MNLFGKIFLLAFFVLNSSILFTQTKADSLLGKRIQTDLIQLVNEDRKGAVLAFIDSIVVSYPEFLNAFPNFHATLNTTAGQAAYEMDRFALANQYDYKAFKILKGIESSDSIYVYNILYNLIVGNIQLGAYEEAESLIKEAFDYLDDQILDYSQIGNLYHKYGTLKYHQAQYDSCLYYFEKVEEYFEQYQGDLEKEWVMLYQGFSSCYKTLEQYSIAIKYDSLALSIYETSESKSSSRLADTYNRYGVSLEELGRLTEAKEYYYKALSLLESDTLEPVYLASTFLNLAYVNFKQSDYGNAIEFFNKVTEIREKILGPNHPNTISSISMTALSWFYLEEYEYSRELFSIVEDRIFEAYPSDHKEVGEFYIRKGALSLELKDFNDAKAYYSMAEDIFLKSYGSDNSFLIYVYNNMAQLELEVGNEEDALNYQLKAIRLSEMFLERGSMRLSKAYNFASQIYLAKEEYQQALAYVEKSFSNLGFDFKNTVASEVAFPFELLEAIKLRAAIYREKYLIDQKRNDLVQFRASCQSALNLFESLRNEIDDYNSQVKLRSKMQEVFESYIESYFDDDLEKNSSAVDSVYSIVEKSKNFDLLIDYSLQSANYEMGVPDSILRREILILESIERIKLDILKSEVNKSDLTEQLLNKQNSLDKFRVQLKEDYPKYFELRYLVQGVPISDVQSSLGRDDFILSYFSGNENMYAILIGQDIKFVKRLGEAQLIDSLVSVLVTNLQNGSELFSKTKLEFDNALTEYAEHAFKLYEMLVGPFMKEINEGSKITIIPDAKLNYLPFEALLSQRPDTESDLREYAYLLNQFVINYDYAASLTLHDVAQRNRGNILGFAPIYNSDKNDESFQRGQLYQLLYNSEEIELLSSFDNSVLFRGASANKTNFLSNYSDAQLIHLAAHGAADNEEGELSYVVFSNMSDSLDSYLYAGELYQLEIPASLVVLSACETASGEYLASEGLMSVGRGFSSAGVAATITSLWNVNDKTSLSLFGDFYDQLESGANSAEALVLAKRSFIKNLESESLAHPYFWAPFVYYGDPDQKISKSFLGLNPLYLLALLPLLVIVIIKFSRKK